MPDNPRTDGELECHLLFRKRSGDIYCIGSKDSDRYIAVRADDAPVVYKALLLLDGSRSVEDAQNKFDKELASGRSLDIGRLYEVARKAGIVSDGSERGFEAHDETDLMLVDIKTVSLEYIMPALEFVAKHLPALSIVGAFLVACAILVAPPCGLLPLLLLVFRLQGADLRMDRSGAVDYPARAFSRSGGGQNGGASQRAVDLLLLLREPRLVR